MLNIFYDNLTADQIIFKTIYLKTFFIDDCIKVSFLIIVKKKKLEIV